MNSIKPLFIMLMLFGFSLGSNAQNQVDPIHSLYDIQINALDGSPIDLSDFKGKKILFVNVASECGFTGQYEDLQALHKSHGEKLTIIGVPCNQFGNQEPGDANEIKTFCEKNYGVEFIITEKIEVKGDNQHDLYKWLTSKSENGKLDSKVKWNFQKYLIDDEGRLIDVYYSSTKPGSDKIVSKL